MKLRVLVVEDEPLDQRVLQKYLEKLGYTVAAVTSPGPAAVEAAEAQALDLALVRVQESRGTGDVQVAEELRDRFHLPVVLLSDHSGMAALDRVTKSGTMGVVVRPFLLEQLGTAIEIALTRHRLERRLDRQRSWFHSVLSGLGEGVIVTDAFGSVSFANRAAEAILGVEARELLEHPILELLRPAAGGEADAAGLPVELLRAGERFQERRFRVLVAGQPRILEMSSRPVEEPEPGRGGLVITLRDITERERQAEAMRLAAQMQAAASLASGIAHHFNNLLQVVMGHAELVANDSPLDGRAHRSAREITRAAEASAQLVTQLKRFSHEERTARELVNVRDLIAELTGLVHAVIPSNISVALPGALFRSAVHVQRQDVLSALLHLVDNARDAMPHGGTLTIGVARRGPANGGGRAQVELSVADTGPGLAPDVRSRVFESFVSTKASGTGLGLASVLRTAQLHDGTVEFDSVPGQGTTFRIVIPEAAAEPGEVVAELGPRITDRQELGGPETILVVEDEGTVRDLIGQALGDLGYAVRSVGLPTEALAILERTPEPVDLLITDLMMPEMNGLELARRAEAARPGLRVILVSAYSPLEAGATMGADESGRPRLDKPFRIDDLARLLRRELDRS